MKDKFEKWAESNHDDLVEKFITKNQGQFDEFAYDEFEGYNNQEPPESEDR